MDLGCKMNWSIVWVIMGRRGYPQNAGVLVVLVHFASCASIGWQTKKSILSLVGQDSSCCDCSWWKTIRCYCNEYFSKYTCISQMISLTLCIGISFLNCDWVYSVLSCFFGNYLIWHYQNVGYSTRECSLIHINVLTIMTLSILWLIGQEMHWLIYLGQTIFSWPVRSYIIITASWKPGPPYLVKTHLEAWPKWQPFYKRHFFHFFFISYFTYDIFNRMF